MQRQVDVLFVCLGNICRSPMAEGVFRNLLMAHDLHAVVGTDSAGTGNYHIGESPDRRAQSTCRGHDVDISDLRARQVGPEDFHRFDIIVAMDASNLDNLNHIRPSGGKAEVGMFLDFAPQPFTGKSVPDPYWGGDEGFENVYTMVLKASEGLLAHVRDGYLAR